MGATPGVDHAAASARRSAEGSKRSRRTRLAIIAGAALSIVVIAALVAVGNDEQEPDSGAVAEHRGMVTGTVWVANEGGGSLTAIDAGTHEVVTTVTGIAGPHNVQVAPDGASLWAVSGHDAYAAMLASSSLDVRGVVPTGSAPAHVVVSPDGATTYATNGADDTVTVIDTASMEAVGTIGVGRGPHGLRPSPDGRWLVVANVADTTLSVIDTQASKRVADIEVGQAPAQVAFSPDGRFVYASLSGESAVAKVDLASRTLLGKIAVGDGPIQVYVSGDNRHLLVANQGTEDRPGTTVSVVDPRTFTVSATVETGEGAHGIVIDPSGQHAYVTNIFGDDVAVLDLDELGVVARIRVGDKPNGISFSPLRLDDPVTQVALPLPGRTAGSGGQTAEEHSANGHEGGH